MLGHPLDELLHGLAASPASIILAVASAALFVFGVFRIVRARRAGLLPLAAIAGSVLLVAGALLNSAHDRGGVELASIQSGGAAQHRDSTGAIPAGTVYIQVPDMDARFAADGVSKALRAAGFKSPGIEVVASGSPSRPEVRYFNPADRPVAERVASIASSQGLSGAAVRAMATYKAPAGQVELWYPQ
ncbi:hypothetical protein IHQ68_13090 [Chelatococcus sambhunathii]|uniref:LytR cell envelope-related transcriptional attenuator n=1 Tax=Chelatococcus sambhunathii TaxID=363953 RepID=A0ABU1DHE8_9HYPH|nr:hypothetical protein [Chelatococcus sambhunathii]MDR4307553.1 hypothetical protein [Chelatococcus sambhunathii]